MPEAIVALRAEQAFGGEPRKRLGDEFLAFLAVIEHLRAHDEKPGINPDIHVAHRDQGTHDAVLARVDRVKALRNAHIAEPGPYRIGVVDVPWPYEPDDPEPAHRSALGPSRPCHSQSCAPWASARS